MATIHAGTMFYRVRAIPDHDPVHQQTMITLADCWEPPEAVVSMGRLNKCRESLLYVAPFDPSVAIEEMKIPEGNLFGLIVYQAAEEISVADIGGSISGKVSTDEDDLLKIEMVRDFMRAEYSRDVGTGTEYLYRISEVIAKDYFDLPPEWQDGWCYPSVVDKRKFNVAFRPAKAHEKLRLVHVVIGEPYRSKNGLLIATHVAAAAPEEGDNLAFYQAGKDVQLDFLFPPEVKNIGLAEQRVGHIPGGIVDRRQQSEAPSAFFQPGVMAAGDLRASDDAPASSE